MQKILFDFICEGRLSGFAWTYKKVFTVEAAHNCQNHRQPLSPAEGSPKMESENAVNAPEPCL